MSIPNNKVLKDISGTCNLYLRLQRNAHRGVSRVSRASTTKIINITAYFFDLKQHAPFVSNSSMNELDRIHVNLEALMQDPTLPELKPVYEDLRSWFAFNLPSFQPYDIADRPRTRNEHNKRMLKKSRLLRSVYRSCGNNLMNDNQLDIQAYLDHRSVLVHAVQELAFQLDADQITVDNRINFDFEELILFINDAVNETEFLGNTVDTIAFINDLTTLGTA